MNDDLTIEKIERIATLSDPVLRNLLITQTYGELSAIFAMRMRAGANWCTFATWASKQAGRTIRQEDLQRTCEQLLSKEPAIDTAMSMMATVVRKLGTSQSFKEIRDRTICWMVEDTSARTAEAVALGNKKVFEEIAHEFCRFITGCFGDDIYDQTHIDVFCGSLKVGLPPHGQEYLSKGFNCYYGALFENDLQKKTQLNLLANLYIGFHEQNRLQPEIAGALNAPADLKRMKSDLFKKLFLGATWWTKVQLFFQPISGNLHDKAIEAVAQLIQPYIRVALTAHLMTITLPPDNCLKLGQDLTVTFPADLLELKNAELVALLAQVDPTPNSVAESGAADWANLSERMHYIADMFRCYHQCTDLFDAAFTETQIEAMKSGRVPVGNL